MKRNLFHRPYYWLVSVNYLLLFNISKKTGQLLRRGSENIQKKAVWALQKSLGAAYMAESERLEDLFNPQQREKKKQ